MSTFDYILEKINVAEVYNEPYEHLWIENFLSDKHYEMMVEDYAECDFDIRDDDHNITANPQWHDIMQFFRSPQFYATLCTRLGIRRSYKDIDSFIMNYMYDGPETLLGFHTDAYTGKQTPQFSIYMPDKDYDKFGTVLVKDQEQNGRKELPLKRNAFVAYGKNPYADFHFVEAGDRVRKSLLVRYR